MFIVESLRKIQTISNQQLMKPVIKKMLTSSFGSTLLRISAEEDCLYNWLNYPLDSCVVRWKNKQLGNSVKLNNLLIPSE
jgi:hypothetical protein